MAIKAIENGNIADLDKVIEVWETNLEEANFEEKKARINTRIAAGLYQNLAIAYMMKKEFDSAKKYAKKAINIIKNLKTEVVPFLQ